MKKLRLIKPWRLKTVRQRLESEISAERDFHERAITCCGPQSQHEYINVSSNWLSNSRIYVAHDGRSVNRGHAPFSDVIFVLSNKRKIT